MTQDKLKAMEKFLQGEYIEWMRKRGRQASQAEWAKHLGVSNASLNQYMVGNRLPQGENIHRLAAKLGPQVYDILNEPRRMPGDPLFAAAARNWFEVDDATRERVAAILEEEARRGKGATSSAAEATGQA